MKRTLLELLREIPDYRRGNGIQHRLEDILLIGILTIICNGEAYSEMELFGETHEETLKQFLALPKGIPSHDTFGDVFSKLDSGILSKLFSEWTLELRNKIEKCAVSIDGKTIRRSKSQEKKAIHVVTAFASELQIVLGQLATEEKSNEITAIPKLLELFAVKGKIITIDAMGTQTEIAKKIIEKEGDYVLALKENHPTLLDDVRLYLETEVKTKTKKELESIGLYKKTIEKNHGRIETRECFLCNDVSWLQDGQLWSGLNGIGVISAKRELIGKEPSFSNHYFLYSKKDITAEELLAIKRSHWSIENQLHWMLDVTFGEDDCRARLENAAENLNILRKQALQLMKNETSVKGSMRSKRLRCSYDVFYAFKVIGVNPIS